MAAVAAAAAAASVALDAIDSLDVLSRAILQVGLLARGRQELEVALEGAWWPSEETHARETSPCVSTVAGWLAGYLTLLAG